MPSRLSTEYVRRVVEGKVNGAVIDPTSDAVAMAIVTVDAQPAPNDFKTASWETDPDGTYLARLLVGPVGGALDFSGITAPVWKDVYVKVTDDPEVPVIFAGRVQFT